MVLTPTVEHGGSVALIPVPVSGGESQLRTCTFHLHNLSSKCIYIQRVSKWMARLQLAVFNASEQLQQWNNLAHVDKHLSFVVRWNSSLVGHCSAAAVFNLKWRRKNKSLNIVFGGCGPSWWTTLAISLRIGWSTTPFSLGRESVSG